MPETLSRRRPQAGLSIVELIIGMAVTSLILTGIVGIIFGVNNSYLSWVGRIANASAGDVLAEAVQADAHRFIACSATAAELDFCGVDGTSPAVIYRSQGPAPYYVIRRAGNQSEVLVRGLAAPPAFHVDCDPLAGVGSGYIEVDGINGIGALRVYYRSPFGRCRTS